MFTSLLFASKLSLLNNLISKSFVQEVLQPGFAKTFTGYIVAAILGKVIFSITLSCYNNKMPGWRVKMKDAFSESAPS